MTPAYRMAVSVAALTAVWRLLTESRRNEWQTAARVVTIRRDDVGRLIAEARP